MARCAPSRFLGILALASLTGLGCSSEGGAEEEGASTSLSETGDSQSAGTDASATATSSAESESSSDATTSDTTSATTTSTSSTTATTSTSSGDGDGDADPPRAATMQVYLADALQEAADIDAGATLVVINAFGVRSDGTVDLVGDTGFARRWNFGFTSPSGDISVIYGSEAWPGDYPQVEYPAGNVVPTDPIVSPTSLPDSDVVAAAFEAEMGCGTLAGGEPLDAMTYLYSTQQGDNTVQITAENFVTWGAIADGGLSVWDSCI